MFCVQRNDLRGRERVGQNGASIGCFVLANFHHRPRAWIPPNDEGDFSLQVQSLLVIGGHELSRIKDGVGAKQQWACVSNSATSSRSSQGEARICFDCPAVSTNEGVHIQRHVPIGQLTEVNRSACDLEPEHHGFDVLHQIKARGCMHIHALAQGGRRWHSAQIQSTDEEGICALAFDSIKVVLAHTQQTEVTLENVAVDNTRADREGRITQAVGVNSLEILANHCQTGLVAQVVG